MPPAAGDGHDEKAATARFVAYAAAPSPIVGCAVAVRGP